MIILGLIFRIYIVKFVLYLSGEKYENKQKEAGFIPF